MLKKSKKDLEDFYTEDLQKEPYKDVSLSDIGSAEDPEAMSKAVSKQKKARGRWDRLKSKTENK